MTKARTPPAKICSGLGAWQNK